LLFINILSIFTHYNEYFVIKMYKRNYFKLLEKRILGPRRFIQVITGPRQVGKTTLAHQLLDTISIPSVYDSADGMIGSTELWIGIQWERARRKLKDTGHPEVVLCLDEVQKIPRWSEHVKREWESDSRNRRPVKVILLGSSRLLLQEGLTESLAGRFESISMTHWKYTEMKEAFGMEPDAYAYYGGYPGATGLIPDETRWKNYVRDALIEPTISKDIFLISRINKPALLKRLFELGAHYSGQVISYNKLLGQLQDAGNTVTLAHYLGLLDQAGLLTGLEKFSMQMVRKRSSNPKFQVYNTAITSCIPNEDFQSARNDPEHWGRKVESVIGSHLLNCAAESAYQVYYWRDRNFEVDFILEKAKQLVAIEVKSGRQKPARGLSEFNRQFRPHQAIIIGTGGIPWEEFLRMDPGVLFG
jgi:predicted AAA+ superfamily ATPase